MSDLISMSYVRVSGELRYYLIDWCGFVSARTYDTPTAAKLAYRLGHVRFVSWENRSPYHY